MPAPGVTAGLADAPTPTMWFRVGGRVHRRPAAHQTASPRVVTSCGKSAWLTLVSSAVHQRHARRPLGGDKRLERPARHDDRVVVRTALDHHADLDRDAAGVT